VFAGEVEGEIALAAALKLAVGAKLARAKSEAFKVIYLYRIADGNQRKTSAGLSLEPHGPLNFTYL
jgi:hypothetical protein